MKYNNLTPHVIRLNDGREIPPDGTVARVTTSYTPFDSDGIANVQFGVVTGLPAPVPETVFIVSGMVAAAVKQERGNPDNRFTEIFERDDIVSPATGHPEAKRENGNIVSVPGFVRA